MDHHNKNGEVLIVTLRRKPNRFEPDAWLGLLYYFESTYRKHLQILSTPHRMNVDTSSPVRFDTSHYALVAA